MFNYNFEDKKFMTREALEKKAWQTVSAAEKLGVPRIYVMDSLWEFDLESASVEFIAQSMKRYFRSGQT